MSDSLSLPLQPGQAVAIFGLNDWSAFYAQLLESAGFSVAFYVAEDGPAEFGGVPVHTEAEAAAAHRAAGQPPLIIASRSPDRASTAFELGAAAAVNKWGLGGRLLHPAFIKAYLATPFPTGVALFGYPSTGNTVIGHLLYNILLRCLGDDEPEIDLTTNLLRILCNEHMNFLTGVLVTLARGLGIWVTQTRQIGLGGLDLAMSGGPYQPSADERGFASEKFLYVAGLRAHTQLAAYRFETHHQPSAAILDEMEALKYTAVAVCRHPLDVLVSLAAKYWRPPDAVLHDLDWFRCQAAALAEWFACALANRERLFFARYEDLLAQPVATVQSFGEVLGLPLTESEAGELADTYLNRTLQQAGSADAVMGRSHLWAPGAGKWRRWLTSAHRAILEELGYGELLAGLGYDPDFARHLEAPPFAGEIAMNPTWLAWYDYTMHRTQGTEITFRHESCQSRDLPGPGLTLVSNAPEYLDTLAPMLETPYWSRLFRAI